jgi:hypothetical protein
MKYCWRRVGGSKIGFSYVVIKVFTSLCHEEDEVWRENGNVFEGDEEVLKERGREWACRWDSPMPAVVRVSVCVCVCCIVSCFDASCVCVINPAARWVFLG